MKFGCQAGIAGAFRVPPWLQPSCYRTRHNGTSQNVTKELPHRPRGPSRRTPRHWAVLDVMDADRHGVEQRPALNRVTKRVRVFRRGLLQPVCNRAKGRDLRDPSRELGLAHLLKALKVFTSRTVAVGWRPGLAPFPICPPGADPWPRRVRMARRGAWLRKTLSHQRHAARVTSWRSR